ncbi:MAG: tripartite tricarboxylate transporter TctB family protein [Hyphomicrobiaceae bacterium]|nr:tripartite tricarboxylate transporter TctB family protein [Hyphomicrobiaceae bacterium]
MDTLNSLLKVQINFDQSHLFFPSIIHWLILILFGVIFIVQIVPFARDVASGKQAFVFAPEGFDSIRFFGALALTVAYILAMDWIGSLFPNRGLGFLFASMAYVLALALLFVHDLDRRKLTAILLNAIAAPSIAWLVFAKLFRITLP